MPMAPGSRTRRLWLERLDDYTTNGFRDKSREILDLGGGQRPKIHQCGISRKNLTLNSSQCTFLSAVVAADWLRLDGGMEAWPVCGDHSAQKGT